MKATTMPNATTTPVHLNLYRIGYHDDGTPGHIQIGPHTFATLELPWRGNAREISCIPPGHYRCAVGLAKSFPRNYAIEHVPGRSGIVFHSGNFAGDKCLGYESHSRGCILLGRACVMPDALGRSQRAVMLSKAAIASMLDILQRAPFSLTIHAPLDPGIPVPPPPKPQPTGKP